MLMKGIRIILKRSLAEERGFQRTEEKSEVQNGRLSTS